MQPSMPFVVDDLTKCSDEELRGRGMTALATLTLLCLRELGHLEPEHVPATFQRWQDLMRLVDQADQPPMTPPLGADAIDAIGWYALAVTEVAAETLSETFATILHRPENTIMSTLERTFQKGLAEGKAEGKAEGRAATILRMLQIRFGTLGSWVEQRVQNGSAQDFDAWTDRILGAASVAEVLDGQNGKSR